IVFIILIFMLPLGKKYLDDFITQSAQVAEKNKITRTLHEMLLENIRIKNVHILSEGALEIEIVSDVLLTKSYLMEVKKHLKEKLKKNYKVTVSYSLQLIE